MHGERRRQVRAEWGRVLGGVFLPQPTMGSGERREELPQRGPGQSSAENGFWRILKATERSFLYLHYMTKSRGTICLSVPLLQILGDLSSPVPP